MNLLKNVVLGIIPPKLVHETIEWNYARNKLFYNESLEISLWKEEIAEYYNAKAVVDKLDAAIDLLFVSVGTVYKYTASKFENTEISFIQDAGSILEAILVDCFVVLADFGIPEGKIAEVFQKAYIIVLEANKQKGTEKTEIGKIKKDKKTFNAPEKQLQQLIENIKKEAERERSNLQKEV